MKRFLFILIALMINVTFAFGNDFKLISGNKKFFKSDATLHLQIDWIEGNWADGQSLQEHWGDEYEKYTTDATSFFTNAFNSSSKSQKIVANESEAQYELKIVVTKVDYFFKVMSFVPGHAHTIWAKVIVTNKATGAEMCVITVTDFNGGRDLNKYDSFTEMFSDLGKEIAEF